MEPSTKRQLIAALESTRAIVPGFNNWLLFSAMVEAGLAKLGVVDRLRVDYALRQHEQWYKGDGVYGDGPQFHWDYYSFVIQPMMLDVLDACGDEVPAWKEMSARVRDRARRHAAILERLVAPDGSFPAVGRSIAYRCGAFQLLAQMALRRDLPADVSPAGARRAHGRDSPHARGRRHLMRTDGCGSASPAISRASASALHFDRQPVSVLGRVMLLGLPAADPFWSSPPAWTAVKAWSGQPFPIDHAL